jgi:hypothetical protein
MQGINNKILSYSLFWFYLNLDLTFASSLLKIYFVKCQSLLFSRLCLAAIVNADAISVISSVAKAKEIDDSITAMAIVVGMLNGYIIHQIIRRQAAIIFLFGAESEFFLLNTYQIYTQCAVLAQVKSSK